MFYYVLDGGLEPDVKLYAKRRCGRTDCVVYRDADGKVVAGFREEDRAQLFLNLFDDAIERSYRAPAGKAAA